MTWRESNLESPVNRLETTTLGQICFLLLLAVVPVSVIFVMDICGKINTISPSERAMAYLSGACVSLLLVGIKLFMDEINHSVCSLWQYWKQHEIYRWSRPKYIPVYLSASAVISNNPFLIAHINGDRPLPRDENLSALVPDSETVIPGSDRLIFLFSILLEKLSVSSEQEKSIGDIYINTAVEVDAFVQLRLKTLLSTSRYSHYQNLLFCCQPDYNQQIEEIKSQKQSALVFTLLHYSTESQEENEMASVLLLSSQYDENAVGLFPAMPFSMELHEEEIDRLLRVQQQPNSSLKLLCTSKNQIIEAGKVHQCLGKKDLNLFSDPIHAGTLHFSEIAGDHGDLSVYLLLASLSASYYQQESVLVFYPVNEKLYCQSIGKQPSGRGVAALSPNPEFGPPVSALFLGIAALLSTLLVGVKFEWYVNNLILLSVIAVLVFFIATIGLIIVSHIYINWRWWPVFLSRLR